MIGSRNLIAFSAYVLWHTHMISNRGDTLQNNRTFDNAHGTVKTSTFQITGRTFLDSASKRRIRFANQVEELTQA